MSIKSITLTCEAVWLPITILLLPLNMLMSLPIATDWFEPVIIVFSPPIIVAKLASPPKEDDNEEIIVELLTEEDTVLEIPDTWTVSAYDSIILSLPSTLIVCVLFAITLLSPLTSILSADKSTLFKPKFVWVVNLALIGFWISQTTSLPIVTGKQT